MSNTVTVIVPTFNRAGYLKPCLESLLQQTVPAHQILVIDDGSEDATPEVARSFGDKIQYVRKANGGKPKAVNLGMQIATGTLIWIFDDDDVALPKAIASRLASLERRPAAGFVYSPHYVGHNGPDGRLIAGSLSAATRLPADRFLLALMTGCFFHLNSCLVRRRLYEEVGEFDASLKAGEDYDMQIRLAEHATAVFCEEPSFIFRQHDGARGDSAARYPAHMRSKVFLQYSAQLGQKLRARLPMGSYLVPVQTSVPIACKREALLARAHVMASLGCVPEFLEDLAAAAAADPTSQAWSPADSRKVSDAICAGWAYEAVLLQWPAFVTAVGAIKQLPHGQAVAVALANGLWRLARGYPGTIYVRLQRLLHCWQVRGA